MSEYNKITTADMVGHRVTELADVPNISAAKLKERFDSLSVDVIVPLFNDLVDSLNDKTDSVDDEIDTINDTLDQLDTDIQGKSNVVVDEVVGDGVKIADIYVDGEKHTLSAPTEEQLQEAVDDWLVAHPEATTTVQDGSLTSAKFSNDLKLHTLKDYVTPQMFGAVGDGVADDTIAIQSAINSGTNVYFPAGKYNVTSTIYLKSNITLFGESRFRSTVKSSLDIVIFESTEESSFGIDFNNIGLSKPVGNNYTVKINNPDRCTFVQCSFYGIDTSSTDRSKISGLSLDKGTGNSGFVCEVRDSIFVMALLDLKITDSIVDNCIIWNYNLPYGIGLGGSNITISNCQIVPGRDGGIKTISNNESCRLINVFFDGSYENIISGGGFNQLSSHTIGSISFENCLFYNLINYSINLYNCNMFSVNNCMFSSNNKDRVTNYYEIIFNSNRLIIGRVSNNLLDYSNANEDDTITFIKAYSKETAGVDVVGNKSYTTIKLSNVRLRGSVSNNMFGGKIPLSYGLVGTKTISVDGWVVQLWSFDTYVAVKVYVGASTKTVSAGWTKICDLSDYIDTSLMKFPVTLEFENGSRLSYDAIGSLYHVSDKEKTYSQWGVFTTFIIPITVTYGYELSTD